MTVSMRWGSRARSWSFSPSQIRLELLGQKDNTPVLIGMDIIQGISWRSALQWTLEMQLQAVVAELAGEEQSFYE